MRLKLLPSPEHETAWKTIKSWNYPCNMAFENYVIISIGDIAYVWFEFASAENLVMHACCSPDHKGKWFTKRTYHGIIWTAELLGAKKIFMVGKDKHLIDYVKRLGWQYDPIGWYIDV